MGTCTWSWWGEVRWKPFGEGPMDFLEDDPRAYEGAPVEPHGPQDIRFTTQGEKLYAIALAWPKDRRLTVRSLAEGNDHAFGPVDKGEPLGHGGDIEWNRNEEGLHVALPQDKSCRHALTLRITPTD